MSPLFDAVAVSVVLLTADGAVVELAVAVLVSAVEAVAATGVMTAAAAGVEDALLASVLAPEEPLAGTAASVLSAGLLAAACLSSVLVWGAAVATVIGFTVAALLLLVAGSSSVDLLTFLLEIGFCFVPLGCFRCGAVSLPVPTTSEKGVKPGATEGACWFDGGKLPGVKLAFGLLVG